MKPLQLSITLSIVAIILALLSVTMQFDWNKLDTETSVVTDEVQKTDNSDRITTLPNSNAVTFVDTTMDANPRTDYLQLEEKIARLERQLEGLHRLIRSSGLDLAIPLLGDHPGGPGSLFEQLGKEAASRAQFEMRREELSQQAANIRDNDYSRYGPDRYRELEELNRAARPSRGPDNEQDRTKRSKALDQMIEEFPDAYETSVAVAEQALHEALSGNTEQVEAHLQTLAETSPYTNILTEQGMEALPTIQTFLARQYIDQNRIEEASDLLNQLADKFPNSLIVEPSSGSVPTQPRTALEIVNEIRQEQGLPQ